MMIKREYLSPCYTTSCSDILVVSYQ
ncbi:DUF4113 domain-containing protein [Edwardsiella ictaluri]|nr:hypothetical protein B6E78_15520 [Edwardsiella ictaluri]AVZ83995.1 DUF4113 domain-containing protein [Edwardsiella ictaluri]EKS7762630.1 DUF4113 domain-containing protein [Edwardsiella ictaluri]EKS7769332.1 DUF4113 domain-containing protein [Edwardsiella ictaluri]EKS7772481.1 DUF4113 domain-containing protein [Edwardsiella ictaluri]